MDCDCKITDDGLAYIRTCLHCGKTWEGNHCPSDGYQNPCPHCGVRPAPISDDRDCIEFDKPAVFGVDVMRSDNIPNDTMVLIDRNGDQRIVSIRNVGV